MSSGTSSNTTNGVNSTHNAPYGRGNGSGEGENGAKQKNPAYKKNWQQKYSGSTYQDRRNGKERTSNENGISDSTTFNGSDKYEPRDRRNDDLRRTKRRERDQNNQVPATTSQPQQAPLHAPRVDQQRLDEAKRVNDYIAQPQQPLSVEQEQACSAVQEALPGIGAADIYASLEQNNWDVNKATANLSEEGNTWSDVVRRERKEKEHNKDGNRLPRRPYEERIPRAPRERPERSQHRVNGHTTEHAQQPQPAQQSQPQQPPHHVQQQQSPNHAPPQTHHQSPQHQQIQHQQAQHQQIQPQQQQQQVQQQQQYQQVQHQQIQQRQHQEAFALDGEDLIMGLSRAIEMQLKEINDKSRLLLQMQSELEAIHSSGKDQLTAFQAEKIQLISEKDHLEEQLKAIGERLVVVDDAIEKAEAERIYKLQDFKRKSVSNGFLTNS